MGNPTVFISYSHDNESHKSWVLKLATDLCGHAVNVILDQWDLRLGSDLRFFMENGLSKTSIVLCICSQDYVQKVNGGTGGSGYEGMIMTQTLLKDANYAHIITVVRNNPSEDKVPLSLASKLYIDFSNDIEYLSNYQKLLERIHDEDTTKKPPLGTNPFDSKLALDITVKKSIEQSMYHSVEKSGIVTFKYDNNNGEYNIGGGKYFFATKWSRAGNNSIHAYGEIGYKVGETDFPTTEEDIIKFDFSSNSRTIRTGQIVVIKNGFGNFLAIKMGEIKSSNHGHEIDEMTFEYRIYDLS